ncbi:hypothetical protein, partial [Agrobacterium cavarae]|uniref:hypothetical protein n=1 Tax=Agrobacterium cavarae TaxID=2528239 RepID=UPI0028968AAF
RTGSQQPVIARRPSPWAYEECEVAIADIATDQQATHPKRVRPANTFRELSQPGDELALVPALMLGLDRDLRGWYGSHGDYFRH